MPSYAFGITLWELCTAGHAYADVPQALLGHQIASEGLRPAFPADAPAALVDLAKRCWDPSPAAR